LTGAQSISGQLFKANPFHSTLKMPLRNKNTLFAQVQKIWVYKHKKAQWGMTDCVKLKQRHCWNGSPSRSVFVLGRGAEGGELAALCIIGLSRPLPTGKIMTACSVTLSLIFCAAPIRPQRKRDPPRSFALLNYCEKRAYNAAARPIAPDLLAFFVRCRNY
jgi:hypothetical protein